MRFSDLSVNLRNLDFGFWILGIEFWISGFGFGIWILISGFGFKIFENFRFWVLDFRF